MLNTSTMANRLSYDLANLNGIKIADLKDALQKLEDKQEHHNPKEPLQVTKCRVNFIQQLKDTLSKNKRAKRGAYDKYKDLVINDITKKQWRKFQQKFSNNKTLLKKDNISSERRNRLERFNAWYEEHRPPKGKRGRPKGTTKDRAVH